MLKNILNIVKMRSTAQGSLVGTAFTGETGTKYICTELLHHGNSGIYAVNNDPNYVIKHWIDLKGAVELRIIKDIRKRNPSERIVQVIDIVDSDNYKGMLLPRFAGDMREFGRTSFLWSYKPEDLRRIGVEICRAVSVVHQADYVHLDLKLENLLQTKDGSRIVLADFESARPIGGFTAEGIHTTLLPRLSGAELPPNFDPRRLDLYAIGVMLYQLYHGRLPNLRNGRPFGGEMPKDDEINELLFDSRLPLQLQTLIRNILRLRQEKALIDSAEKLAEELGRVNFPPMVENPLETLQRMLRYQPAVAPAGLLTLIWIVLIMVSTMFVAELAPLPAPIAQPGVELLWIFVIAFGAMIGAMGGGLAVTIAAALGVFIQAFLLAAYNEGAALGLFALAVGMLLTSLFTRERSQLLILALTPLLVSLLTPFSVLPFALILRSRETLRSQLPVITLTLLPWALLFGSVQTCITAPLVCSLLPGLQLSPNLLIDGFGWYTGLLAFDRFAMATFQLMVAVGASISLATVLVLLVSLVLEVGTIRFLTPSRLLTEGFFPLARAVISCTVQMIYFGLVFVIIQQTQGLDADQFFVDDLTALLPVLLQPAILLLILFSMLEDPPEVVRDYVQTRWYMLLLPVVPVGLMLLLPLLVGMIRS